ncbi:MAG TPA: glycerol kinase GlpK [Spirochaetota bacterium]|jgi:glycerol kinase|nr:glycerol kinase GlpK [Spirochaetota bacterium]OPZ39713.1 MAG: Glycerol kinase [Spirochaetes bacterium ADurb.BinA120]HNU92999.1 glycerol kinase GlpK [Spirochaetota bacterium]HPI15465.1 glycerol kinase GlpK [Spirochaetota bacterium]HPV98742.1 glycerol kinase GlpK [Spirochaetota bacterium]
MGNKFIIALDLGTTGNRVFCFDESGLPISSAYREFTQHFPRPGWVEHDPEEIWSSLAGLIPEAIAKGNLNPSDAITIGITNQRETAVLWNRDTGKPVYNAIVWQCRRTTDICNDIKNRGHEETFKKKTGLVVDAYFSGTKIKWILDNVAGARELAKTGKLLFGTVDTWILWKLSGGKSHATDYTNASRTLVFNIVEKCWDRELLEILDIPAGILPEVRDSSSFFGKTLAAPGLPDGVPIGGIAGDQQAAMVGQNCVFEGTIKNTYGTGCFMLLNTGRSFVLSDKGLLTTIACDAHGKPCYAFEGSVFVAGAVVQWLRDYMKFFEESSDSDRLALSFEKDDEVVMIPAFVGLGAPYWKMDARGAIFGLTRDTTREQIVRAALRSIAFQSMDVIEVMQQDSGKTINELRADGGATRGPYLMQFQADILGIPVLLPEVIESTALGAAYLAGLSSGLYGAIDEVAKRNRIVKRYTPNFTEQERSSQRKLWKDAVKRLL